MSERKVLNKYYPPDFDPSKIPKMRMPKNRTFSIRIMAPFNMRCNTCGEYIYKGKKFNSRKENVDDEFYLGLRIFRFYIKCPRCVAEIAFKTDLENTDYALEAGAARLFEAEKLAQKMAAAEQKEKEDEEMNPMKVLENRTKASRNEIEELDKLEELKEINSKKANLDHEQMIEVHQKYEELLARLQDEEDEKIIESIFGEKNGEAVKRLADTDSDEDSCDAPPVKKQPPPERPTDIFAEVNPEKKKEETKKQESWQRSVGSLSSKNSLANLVVKKKPAAKTSSTVTNNTTSQSQAVPNKDNSSSKDTEPKKQSKPVLSGLSMLGNYSGSDSEEVSE
ncbi:splicing factor YJU2-like [Haliotis cracherodii]|uniref:splicing factor YJU2-like n=1 Tax=Haliotis cracherodii TaxID=6455 RepID=UPI0039E92539